MATDEHPPRAPDSSVLASQASVFRTTRWNVIRSAQQAEGAAAREGLERLARTYWYPLYAFARRQGLREEDAQDLTQGFLARILTGERLQGVDPSKGKFRSFLLSCFKHYLADERERSQAVKRGGGVEFVPLDTSVAEERYHLESVLLNQEEHYDRDWAQSLMSEVLNKLRLEWRESGKEDRFRALQPFLMEDPTAEEQVALRQTLSLGESGLRSALQRLRFRLGEYLWTEVARTVEASSDVDGETRYVLGILSRTEPVAPRR